MEQSGLIPHLFRTEFRKITAVLCKHFGLAHLEVAEDIASDTFMAALQTWPYRGAPDNPKAWLYAVAKNKTRQYLHREALFDRYASTLAQDSSQHDVDLSDQNITYSQLQMIFAVCHPALPAEAQVGLALRTLCGLGIDEIAAAFLTNRETIQKRLFRAREKIRTAQISMSFPPKQEIAGRLDAVLLTLYLLFNEGYHSESREEVLRDDLCREAMMLTRLLLNHPPACTPSAHALLALMCFHASRFPARKNAEGELVLYAAQDESLWDQSLIAEGARLLATAATGATLSRYHLEAGIAYWHTIKTDTQEKWQNILHLYNYLMVQEYSPIGALNRTYALSKVYGQKTGIEAAEKLGLEGNRYYHALLGELYTELDREKAREHFEKAIKLTAVAAAKRMLEAKVEMLK